MLSILTSRFSLVQNAPAARPAEARQATAQDVFVSELISHLRNKALSDEQCMIAIRASLGKALSY